MNMNVGDWQYIGAYLAVARSGSLSAAARILGLSQPTVRRQIEALESELGIALFTRSQTGLVPTDTGRILIGHAEAMEAAAGAFSRTASQDLSGTNGTVRVTCSDVFGVERLPDAFARLRTIYPDITIELNLTNRVEDILHREADIAIRLTEPVQSALVSRKVRPVELGLFATAELATSAFSVGGYDAFCETCPFIGDDKRDLIAAGLAAFNLQMPKNVVYRTDSDLAQLAAIRAGVGFGICQVPIARASGLVRVFPELDAKLDVWVVVHEDLKAVRRVRLVFDHLVATFLKAGQPSSAG